ncbi:MAG TPA: DUF397 domain-containing protein [Pseudonocardiaceae bacterium]|nr:DUF397 domain-containing protein [Pseudonocardiaceae bacterium]
MRRWGPDDGRTFPARQACPTPTGPCSWRTGDQLATRRRLRIPERVAAGRSCVAGATWRKSSCSNGQASCVEVADLDGGQHAVRDSKNPTGPVLIVTSTQWVTFTTALHTGDLA